MAYKISLTVWLVLFITWPIWTVFMVLNALYTLLIKVGWKTYFDKSSARERPPLLDDPQFGEHGYVHLENGIKIHYVAAGDSNKPLMLCLHGFPEFWFCWRHQLKYFKDTYRVVAVDLRGYGESSKPQGVSSYSMDKLVEDVRLIILGLGYEDCVLVAHDWGGVLAWAVAGKYPELVKKLIAGNGPHLATLVDEIGASVTQMLKSWYVAFFQTPYLPEIILGAQDAKFLGKRKGASSEESRTFQYTFGQKGALTGPIDYYRALFRCHGSYNYSTSPIGVPSLLIWGDNDPALNTSMAERHRKYVRELTIRYMKGASHFCQQERPDEFNTIMKEFLKQ